MKSKQALYRILAHTPVMRSTSFGAPIGDVSIHGIEDDCPAGLRQWVVAQSWPTGTIFEVCRTGRNGDRLVRSTQGQIAAWRTSRDAMPLGSDINLPRSSRCEFQTFESMLAFSLRYAVEHGLMTSAGTDRLQDAILNELAANLAVPQR